MYLSAYDAHVHARSELHTLLLAGTCPKSFPPAHEMLQVAHTRAASQQPASQRSHGSISGHLPLIMEQFTTSLSACQDLWDCLEDFDAHAWVLEPVAPSVHSSGATATASSSSSSVNASAATGTRADAGALCSERRLRGGGTCLRRRLMLGQHCSLEVVLDPLHPRRNTMEVRTVWWGAQWGLHRQAQAVRGGISGWSMHKHA